MSEWYSGTCVIRIFKFLMKGCFLTLKTSLISIFFGLILSSVISILLNIILYNIKYIIITKTNPC